MIDPTVKALGEIASRSQRVPLLMQLYVTAVFLNNELEQERIKVSIEEELALYYEAVKTHRRLSGA